MEWGGAGDTAETTQKMVKQMHKSCWQRAGSHSWLAEEQGCVMDDRGKLFQIITRNWRISCCAVNTVHCRKGGGEDKRRQKHARIMASVVAGRGSWVGRVYSCSPPTPAGAYGSQTLTLFSWLQSSRYPPCPRRHSSLSLPLILAPPGLLSPQCKNQGEAHTTSRPDHSF